MEIITPSLTGNRRRGCSQIVSMDPAAVGWAALDGVPGLEAEEPPIRRRSPVDRDRSAPNRRPARQHRHERGDVTVLAMNAHRRAGHGSREHSGPGPHDPVHGGIARAFSRYRPTGPSGDPMAPRAPATRLPDVELLVGQGRPQPDGRRSATGCGLGQQAVDEERATGSCSWRMTRCICDVPSGCGHPLRFGGRLDAFGRSRSTMDLNGIEAAGTAHSLTQSFAMRLRQCRLAVGLGHAACRGEAARLQSQPHLDERVGNRLKAGDRLRMPVAHGIPARILELPASMPHTGHGKGAFPLHRFVEHPEAEPSAPARRRPEPHIVEAISPMGRCGPLHLHRWAEIDSSSVGLQEKKRSFRPGPTAAVRRSTRQISDRTVGGVVLEPWRRQPPSRPLRPVRMANASDRCQAR